MSHSGSKRIPELDGLRGIAILLVISFHYVNNQLLHSTNKVGVWLAKITSLGWVGVDLFFVLSGFLITNILLVNRNSKNYFSTFYIRRIVRILPNYYLLLALFFCIAYIQYFQSNSFLTGNVIPNWSYLLLVHNFYMAEFNTMGVGTISVLWSIAIEEQFYLIYPVILFFAKRDWVPYVLIVVVAVAILFRAYQESWIPAYVLLAARMDSLAIGGLIAYAYNNCDLKAIVEKYYVALLSSAILITVLSGLVYLIFNDLGAIRHTLFALLFGSCLILALTKKNNLFVAVLRNKGLVFIGSLSYSLYLFHYMFLGFYHHIIGHRNGVGVENMNQFIFSLFPLIITFLFSWIVFNWLESPMVGVGRKFKYAVT